MVCVFFVKERAWIEKAKITFKESIIQLASTKCTESENDKSRAVKL